MQANVWAYSGNATKGDHGVMFVSGYAYGPRPEVVQGLQREMKERWPEADGWKEHVLRVDPVAIGLRDCWVQLSHLDRWAFLANLLGTLLEGAETEHDGFVEAMRQTWAIGGGGP